MSDADLDGRFGPADGRSDDRHDRAAAAVAAVPAYRADGRPVDREAFYALACDPRRSIVVEACAGAGKTWMLVSRIVRALLEGTPPNEIVAITFTKKAAGEMRERLEEWLVEFAEKTGEAGRVHALRERGMAPDEAERLGSALGRLHEQVLASGRSVQVHTFHAWFAQLLGAAPIETLDALGLAPEPELVEKTEELWPDLLRRFHRRVAGEAALRTDHEAVVRGRGRLVTMHWLKSAWNRRIEFALADGAGVVDRCMPAVADAFPAFRGLSYPAERLHGQGVRKLFEHLAAQLGKRPNAVPRQCAEAIVDALSLEDAALALGRLREALLTKRGVPRKAMAAPALEKAVAMLDEIQRATEQHEACEMHARMTRLTRVLLEEYALLKRRRGIVDMADLERAALSLLGDSAVSARIQQRLDARIAHLLVDEFQDTNPIQWHALYGWLSAYAGAGGRGLGGRSGPSVFIVGDPKQSIYRFRGAEPRVFEQARAFVVEGLGGSLLECDHTRRLEPEMLAVVNRVFEEARSEGGFPGFRPHSTECSRTDGPALLALSPALRVRSAAAAEMPAAPVWRDSLNVPRTAAEDRLRRKEARVVALGVKATIDAGTPAGDIFVLCRKRDSLRLAAQELQMLDVTYAAPEDFALMEAVEVGDLVALLQFLVAPAQSLPLARALKSPIFRADDEDLVKLALAVRAVGGTWWRALQGLPSPSKALERALALLPGWIAAARELPPHDLLDRIVDEGDLRARYAAAVPVHRRAAALAAIDALVTLALDLDGARYATPARFAQALVTRSLEAASPRVPDAVQLLTIHGAKGLESPVVFLMDTDPERTKDGIATVLVDWTADAPAPRAFVFVASESRFPPALDALMQQEWQARLREEMNSLYVALTRAERQVVLSRTEPHLESEGRSWWERMAGLATPWAPEGVSAAARSASASFTLPELPRLGGTSGRVDAAAGAATDGSARGRTSPGGASAATTFEPVPLGPEASVATVVAAAAGLLPDALVPAAAVRADLDAGSRSVRSAASVDSPTNVIATAAADDAADVRAAALGRAVHRLLEWATNGALADESFESAGVAACIEFGADVGAASFVAASARCMLAGPEARRFFDAASFAWAGNEVGVTLADGGSARIDRLVAFDGDGGRVWWVLDYKLSHAPQRTPAHVEQLGRYAAAVKRLQPGDAVRAAFISGAGEVIELSAAAE